MCGNIIGIAAGLVSEDGENPEYDRALVEVTCEALGVPITDNREAVAQLIGVVQP